MPNNTVNYNIPYPVPADNFNLTSDLASMATATDGAIKSVELAAKNNVRRVTASTSSSNNDYIIADSTSNISIALPSSPQEDDVVRMVQFSTGSATFTSASTIHGSVTTTGQNSGIIAVYTNSAWWCSPLSSSQSSTTTGWTRPADWISIPELIEGESVVYGILPIYPNIPNSCFFIARGDYSVDWGDGSAIELYNSGDVAFHEYDENDISPSTLTSQGFLQALIEVRPQAGKQLTDFLPSNIEYDPNIDTYSNHPEIKWTRFVEIQVTSPDFVMIPTAIPKWSISPIALTIKYANQISEQTINESNKFVPYSSDMEYLYMDLPLIEQFSAYAFSGNYTDKIKEAYFVIPNATKILDCWYDIPNLTKLTFETSNVLTTVRIGYCLRRDIQLTITDTSAVTDWSKFLAEDLNYGNYPTTYYLPFDFSNGINFTYFYAWAYHAEFLPTIDISSAEIVYGLFDYCVNLVETPTLYLPNVTNANYMFNYCTSLRRSNISGLTCTHSYEYCQLNASELDNMYTNLGDALPGATITVTGNIGISGDDPSIATNKGWTVIG